MFLFVVPDSTTKRSLVAGVVTAGYWLIFVTMVAAIKASAAKTVAAARIRLRVSELMACLPRFPHHLLRRLFRLVHHR